MALKGEKVDWNNDVVSLFTRLDTSRKRFGFPGVSPSGGGIGEKTTPDPYSTMKTDIEAMKSHENLKNLDTSSLVIPSVGDLLTAAFSTNWGNVLTVIENTPVCTSNVTFSFTDNQGFGFTSNQGFSFSSEEGFSFSDYQGFSFTQDWSFSFSDYQGFSFSENWEFSFGSCAGFSFSFATDTAGFSFVHGDWTFTI